MPLHPLSDAVVDALGALVEEGRVPWQGALPDAAEADDARVDRDRSGYASSLPLRLAVRAGLPAPHLAGLLADRLSTSAGVGSAVVAGPGYLELEPDPSALVRAALTSGRGTPDGTAASLDPLPSGTLPERLSEAVAEVGADAVRFALARRMADRPLDLALLGRADDRNPVHAVQLAHAGLSGVLRQAADLGVRPEEAVDVEPRLMSGSPDRELVAAVAEAGAVRSRAVRLGRSDLLARHLERTAEAAHRFLVSGGLLPRGDAAADETHRARLRLAASARDALAEGLDLLGVTAPERM